MALKTIINNQTDDLGSSNELTCPECGNKVRMRLFSNYDSNSLIATVLNKEKELNFCVCPNCKTVFKINMSSYGIQNSDLKDYYLEKLNGKTT